MLLDGSPIGQFHLRPIARGLFQSHKRHEVTAFLHGVVILTVVDDPLILLCFAQLASTFHPNPHIIFNDLFGLGAQSGMGCWIVVETPHDVLPEIAIETISRMSFLLGDRVFGVEVNNHLVGFLNVLTQVETCQGVRENTWGIFEIAFPRPRVCDVFLQHSGQA